MAKKKLLATGLVGTLVTAACCFTPFLVITLAAVGVASVAWLDFALFPLLFGFLCLTAYALIMGRRA